MSSEEWSAAESGLKSAGRRSLDMESLTAGSKRTFTAGRNLPVLAHALIPPWSRIGRLLISAAASGLLSSNARHQAGLLAQSSRALKRTGAIAGAKPILDVLLDTVEEDVGRRWIPPW